MFIAPTEPTALKAIGKVSSRPERYGVDVLFPAQGEWCGVQRKEISDLIASVHDGRLQREVAQMQHLAKRMVLVEGRLQWTSDGVLLGKGFGRDWTRAMHDGMMWSLQDRGIWVGTAANIGETVAAVLRFQKWCKKTKHTALTRRPGPAGDAWGTVGSKDFGMHLLMGIEGVGPELADAIWERFGGVPLEWSVGRDELLGVKGLGPKKVDRMMAAVRGRDSEP